MLRVLPAQGKFVCKKSRNLREWRDSRVILSNQKQVFMQLATTSFVARQVLLQDSFCSNLAKHVQVTRFFLPFYRSFKELVFIDPLNCMFLFSQCRSCNNTQEDCFFFQIFFLFPPYASIIFEKTTGRLSLRPSLGKQIQAKKVYLRYTDDS